MLSFQALRARLNKWAFLVLNSVLRSFSEVAVRPVQCGLAACPSQPRGHLLKIRIPQEGQRTDCMATSFTVNSDALVIVPSGARFGVIASRVSGGVSLESL